MTTKLAEIPIIEDIYDFDSITLREATEKVQNTQAFIEKLETKEQHHLLWLKKAKRYLELALNEIEERKAVENFGNFCIENSEENYNSNTQLQYLGQTSSNGLSSDNGNSSGADNHYNNNLKKNNNLQQQKDQQTQQQPYGNVDQWIKLHQMLSSTDSTSQLSQNSSQAMGVPKYLNPIGVNSQQYAVADRIEEEEESIDNEREDNFSQTSSVRNQLHNQSDSGKDICNESTISGRSHGSAASSQLKYLAHQNRLKNKTKQDLMQEFIKQTLDKTRITANEIPTPFYSTGPRSNFSSDDGVQLKKKKSFDSAAPQQANKKPRARASLDRPLETEGSSSSEYSNVQSRIKQDLEQQRLKKLETPYFTTGKASYPKYKPPAEKKINPEEERKKKTKNFLKRSTASVILPPLLSKPPLPKSQDTKLSKDEVSKSNNSLRRQSTDQILGQNGNNQHESVSTDRSNTNVLSPNKIILEPLDQKRSNTTQSEGDQSNYTDNSKIQREISEASQADESDGYEEQEKKEQIIRSQSNSSGNTIQGATIKTEKSSLVHQISHSAGGTQKEKEYDQKEDSNEEDTEEQAVETINHEIDSKTFQKTNYTNSTEEDKKYVIKSTQVIGQNQKEEQMNIEKSASENMILRQASLDQDIKGELNKQDQSQQKQQDQQSITQNKMQDQNIEIQKETQLNCQETKDNSSKDDKIKLTWQEREKDENPSDSDDDQIAINDNIEIKENTKGQIDSSNIQGDIDIQEDKQNKEYIEDNNPGINSNSRTNSSRRITESTEITQTKQRDSGEFTHTDQLRQKMARLMEGLSQIGKEGENDEDEDLEDEESQQTELKQENSKSQSKSTDNNHNNNQKPPLKKKTEIFGRPRVARTSSSSSNTSLTAPSNSSASTDITTTAAPIDKKKQLRNTDNKSKNDISDDRNSNNSKIEQSNSKTKETQQVDEEPSTQQSQDQTKIKKKLTGVKSSAAGSSAQNQASSQQSKLLMKMLKELGEDNQLIDYSTHIPTFNHLFSGFYNAIWTASNPMMGGNLASTATLNTNFCLIDHMRDIYSLFAQHVEKVDNADKALLRYKAVVTPLEVLPSEVYYVNDPTKVAVYQNRVDIDIRKFIERQIIFTQRMNGENFAGHLLPHEEFYFRVVKSKPEVYDIISRSFMRKRDWFELPHGLQLRTSWNLLWTWSKPQIDFNKLLLFQKVNHFPFNKNLVRKDLLKKNFERITKLGPKAAQAFNILPVTFVLPKEYCNFSERFYEDILKEGEDNIWIMKPVGKSQGRGISLVNDISQVVYAEPVVVQKYMKDPLLLEGYKFDMRIYALVTHMKPLEAFVYQEGFARLSTEKYTLNSDNIRNNQIHLTNFSIQKHHYDYSSGANFIGGTKISLRMLQEKLNTRGISWEKIWTQVQEIIVKSLLACQADIPNNPNCFEIFGYDIIIDSSLKCVLLEINSSPSLARDFIIDDLIKQQMVDDALDLIQPLQFDRLRLLEVFDRRIREEQGNKSNINTTNNSKLQLNRDLNYILRGQKIRNFGEIPNFIGHWQPIAPTPMSDKYFKIIQSYKLPSVRQGTASAANNNNTID